MSFQRFQFLLPTMGADKYYPIAKSLSPLAYWPLWDAAGSATAVELINGWNGTPSSVTFGNTGIGDGKKSTLIGATNSYINVYSTALRDAFPSAAGSMHIWAKVSASGVWSDSANRIWFEFRVNASNYIHIYKTSTNTLRWQYVAGGTSSDYFESPPSDTDFIPLTITWSKANNRVRGYIWGGQAGAEVSGLGVWAGQIASTTTLLGSLLTNSGACSSYIAHAILFNRELTKSEVQTLAWSSYKPPVVGFGDSITAGTGASDAAHRWLNLVHAAKGWGHLTNSGGVATVLQNTVQNTVSTIGGACDNNGRDRYATAVVAHRPDYVLILYGLNDLRLNDVAFTADLFENDLGEVIDGMIAGGTSASQIVIGSPPHISDYTAGAPEYNGGSIAKHQAYTAKCAAVAAAKGTKYIDVYQWMIDNGGDSLVSGDGVHPNDAGHQAIANAFLSVM